MSVVSAWVSKQTRATRLRSWPLASGATSLPETRRLLGAPRRKDGSDERSEAAQRSARRKSQADPYRSRRSLARHFLTTSSTAEDTSVIAESRGGLRLLWLPWTTAGGPQNGGRPASISKRMTPIA